MKKISFIIFFLIPFIITEAFVKQDKIKVTLENKDGLSYVKLGSSDGLKNGSILIGYDEKKKPYFLEILGIVNPHYSIFQRIEFVWDNKENKINLNYLDKHNLNSVLEISELYDNFEMVAINKLKETELLYKKANENLDKKRLNLSKKYFEDCLNIIVDYRDTKEMLSNLNKSLESYKKKTETQDNNWKKTIEQAKRLKSDGSFKEALINLQNLALDYPVNREIRFELGLLYSEMGNIYMSSDYTNEAISEIEELLLINPEADNMRQELAFLYYYQGEKDKAMEHFEQLASRGSGNSMIELRELMNKLLFISSRQSDNSVKGMCNLCLNPLSENKNRLTNGLFICGKCNDDQIRNKQDVKTFFKKIENFFGERYKMKIRNIKDFIPDDDLKLKEITDVSDMKNMPLVFFKPVYTEYEVHYLDSLPRIIIIEGLASEFVKVWLAEQNLECIDPQMKEGIAMYFEYVLLNHFQYRDQTERFVYRNDSASLGFRRIKAIVETRGEGKLIDDIRKCFE